ncbi:phage tail protein [Labilibacter sediminis]|nr:phage tail protein [Labilibacter sediminis]
MFVIILLGTGLFAQDPMLGEIKLFAGNFAPRGWAFCDGQLLAINQHSALFSLLGTMYGGDGRTTFGLPDLRGRVPMHAGTGPGLSSRIQGAKSGTETNVLNANHLPSHNHGVQINNPVYNDEANTDDPTGKYPAVSGENMYSDQTSGNGALPQITIQNAGGSQPVNNMQPYLVVRYIIALQGYYPSRD